MAGDSGTITLRCKDLRVLQLDIEGVEATLDIARSIEVCRGVPEVLKLPLSSTEGSKKGLLCKGAPYRCYPEAQLNGRACRMAEDTRRGGS